MSLNNRLIINIFPTTVSPDFAQMAVFTAADDLYKTVKMDLTLAKISWSPNSTDLYFWYLFVELAVATPVEPRNFVSVVPAAKKGKLGPIFLKNICVMYIPSVKKQRTGQKTGKNPPKKVVFPAPPISWLSLDRFWTGQNPFKQTLSWTKSVRTDFDQSKSV